MGWRSKAEGVAWFILYRILGGALVILKVINFTIFN
jgi:hypothetical protein